MANAMRGETDIMLAGREYTLRPTFNALCELENKTGSGLFELAKRFDEGRFTLHDIASVIWSGIRAGGCAEPPAFETVGEWIAVQGMASVIKPVTHYLYLALGGSHDAVSAH